MVVLAALGFAPPAFAADGLVATPVTAGPVTVSASVGSTSDPAVTAAASTAVPAATPPATPVAKPLAKPHVQTSVAASPSNVAVRTDPGTTAVVHVESAVVQVESRMPRTLPRTLPTRDAVTPQAAPKHRLPSRKATFVASATPRPQQAARTARTASSPRHRDSLFPTGSLSVGKLHTLGVRTTPQAPETPRLPAPQLPSSGFGAAGAGGPGFGLGLVLLALAAGLGILGLPRLGQRVSPLISAPRPYPYRLQLERPG